MELSQLTQLQSPLKQTCLGFLADLLFVWLLFFGLKVHRSSSKFTHQMTAGGPGGPRPKCTPFFYDRSWIFEEACGEKEEKKRPILLLQLQNDLFFFNNSSIVSFSKHRNTPRTVYNVLSNKKKTFK